MKASTPSKASFLKPSSKVRQDLGFDTWQWVVASLGTLLWLTLCVLAFWIWPNHAMAQERESGEVLRGQVEGLLRQLKLPQTQGSGQPPLRVEVVLGQLDPRLKLAPCDQVRAYMPEGQRLWGRTRVGLRCESGPVKWNVFWPVTVKIWGQGLVAMAPLRPGVAIQPSDLRIAEVDLAEDASPALIRAAELIGRYVSRGIQAGESVRQDDIKARRWFAAGDPVRLTIRGPGFQVASEGTALTHGDEGHCARVRTESGRVICGLPTGERQVELSL
ncbi:MAG: flagellar basal body P-ring formation chaperone FlgA [Aquabacterium sp.]